jgi:hypothetical protein
MTLKKIELILIALVALGLFLNYVVLLPQTAMLLVTSLGTLSIIYFLNGFAVVNEGDGSPQKGMVLKLENIANFAFSVFVIGFLFSIQSWPNSSYFLKIGGASILLVLLMLGVNYSKTQTYNAYILKRALIYGLLEVVLLSLPPYTLIDIKYRNHPAYAEALKKTMENPGDSALRAKFEAERAKLNK